MWGMTVADVRGRGGVLMAVAGIVGLIAVACGGGGGSDEALRVGCWTSARHGKRRWWRRRVG